MSLQNQTTLRLTPKVALSCVQPAPDSPISQNESKNAEPPAEKVTDVLIAKLKPIQNSGFQSLGEIKDPYIGRHIQKKLDEYSLAAKGAHSKLVYKISFFIFLASIGWLFFFWLRLILFYSRLPLALLITLVDFIISAIVTLISFYFVNKSGSNTGLQNCKFSGIWLKKYYFGKEEQKLKEFLNESGYDVICNVDTLESLNPSLPFDKKKGGTPTGGFIFYKKGVKADFEKIKTYLTE